MSLYHVQYSIYPNTERLENYQIGGFHPVNLNDILHDRYQVINKLGHGSYGTIWLVEDLTSGQLASLKIIASKVSKSVSEAAILQHIENSKESSTHHGRHFIVKFLDAFQIDGPNGTHQCIVTELLGPSLNANFEDVFEGGTKYDDFLPIGVAKSVTAKVIRGVAFLLSIDIIHSG